MPKLKIERIGETQEMNNGLMATIIAYRKNTDIDIQFENGLTVCNREYKWFSRGNIACPMIINCHGAYVEIINPSTTPKTIILIDTDDIPLLGKYIWGINGDGYIQRNSNPGCIKLHRLVMQAKPNEQIDHINGCKTDNRKSNLRICTNAQNTRNKKKRSDNTVGYKGITFDNRNQKYYARICKDGKRISLGYYADIKEAVKVYNDAALKYHGEFAQLNQID